ncbi:MAG: DegT/DnrJ/EryC1/StrS family aminotransferase [Oscillospiraceae bacterium]|nr:DegT/DnrJ/EryC1/StrS family aminotransferase [Oscillospiraceae bacterium]
MNRIFLSPPYMGGGEQKYISEAFESNWIAPLGPNVTAFEREVSELLSVPYPLALSSGTAAIHLALKYLGVGQGDIVLCSSFTFIGSCGAAAFEKAGLAFVDSEPETWNMSPRALEKALAYYDGIGKRPKAVIVVDLYGQSADWDGLLPVCARYGVPVIEDAAEALGASYKGRMCGSFGDVGALSFNGNKLVTTSGGGMTLCHTKEQYDRLLFWATQAKEPLPHYEHREIGYNYRLSNICAGIGRGQLEILPEKLRRRKAIFERYKAAFEGTPVRVMPVSDQGIPNCWLTAVTLDDSAGVTPAEICGHMNTLNIETRPAWKPMHAQPVFADCKAFPHNDDGSFFCETVFAHGLCLPSGDALTTEQQDMVVSEITRII